MDFFGIFPVALFFCAGLCYIFSRVWSPGGLSDRRYMICGRRENMVVAVRSLGLNGISGYEVSAECFLSGGLSAGRSFYAGGVKIW